MIIATKVCGPMGAGPNDAGLSRQHIMEGAGREIGRADEHGTEIPVYDRERAARLERADARDLPAADQRVARDVLAARALQSRAGFPRA